MNLLSHEWNAGMERGEQEELMKQAERESSGSSPLSGQPLQMDFLL